MQIIRIFIVFIQIKFHISSVLMDINILDYQYIGNISTSVKYMINP